MKAYESKRSQLVEMKITKEREPSKEKPDINASSSNILEQKKKAIFEKIFAIISLDENNVSSKFVDPATANFRSLPI
jgi:hypothetical protein